MIAFFACPPQIRKVIYTTNALESVKTRATSPATMRPPKLIWLALRNFTAERGRAAKDWKEAMNQFAIRYEDRFTNADA